MKYLISLFSSFLLSQTLYQGSLEFSYNGSETGSFSSNLEDTTNFAGALNVNTILIKPFNHATLFYWDQKSNKTPWYPSIDLVDGDMVSDKKKFIELVYSKLK